MSALKKKKDRREFLKSIVRNSILSGIGLFIGSNLKKKDKKIDHNCYNNGICKNCDLINSCALPQVLSLKNSDLFKKKIREIKK